MDLDRMLSAVQTRQSAVTGKLAFGFRDLTSGETLYWNGTDVMPIASMFKLFVLAELYRQAECGAINLGERIPLTPESIAIGGGLLQHLSPGLAPTVHDHATLMMILSDNTSTDILFRRVGRENVQKNILAHYGFTDTRCDLDCGELICSYYEVPMGSSFQTILTNLKPRYLNTPGYLCTAPQNDQSTMHDLIRYFTLLHNGELVSPQACAGILDILKRCQLNKRIPARIPMLPIAHKTGTMDRVAADGGIVYTKKGAYALTLIYNGNTASPEEYDRNVNGYLSDELLANVSRDVYEEYMR